MSEERRYSIDILRAALAGHVHDAETSGRTEWLARVLVLLGCEINVVPPLEEEEADTVPEYIYPH